MALPSGFNTTLSNPISVRLVLLGLVVMPVAVLVLPFNVDGHRIAPTTPTLIPPTLLSSTGKRKRQPQRQVPFVLIEEVLVMMPSSRVITRFPHQIS